MKKSYSTYKPTDFGKQLTEFLGHYLKVECGFSDRTIATYSYSFSLLLKYIEKEYLKKPERVTLSDISKNVIIKYLNWLETDRKCSISTRNGRLAAIKSFYKFLQYRNIEGIGKWQEILSIRVKKAPEPVTTHLSMDGMKILLEQPDLSKRRGRRDLALLGFLYDTGCRVQELIDCTPSSLYYDGEATQVRIHGKGNKMRDVPLSESTLRCLKNYMEEYGLDKQEYRNHPLFSNPKGNKLSRVSISKTIDKYVRMARQKSPDLIPEGISCHSFRRSKAIHMAENNVGLIAIRDLLGHVNISTTAIYAKTSEIIKKKALAKLDPSIVIDGESSWQKDSELMAYLKDLQRNS